jgi:hypothetical protein
LIDLFTQQIDASAERSSRAGTHYRFLFQI